MPYWDQNSKLISEYIRGATIGYGHLIKNAAEFDKYKNGITDTMANVIFNDDLYNFIGAVRHQVREKLTQNEFDALVMFSFNIGVTGFTTSRVLKIINGSIIGDLRKAWQSYKYSHQRIMSGLMNRRDAEMNIFFNGVYFKK
jgi:GH24 family phage-related lysozyme (muramidase)